MENKQEGISSLDIYLNDSDMENKAYILISGIAIGATVVTLGFVLASPMLGIPLGDTLYNQLGVIALMLSLVGYFISLLQNNQSIENFQQVNKQLSGIETSLDELKHQNQPPESNPGDAGISEVHDDGNTKTVVTRFTSDNVTVTSTLKITVRRE